MKKTLALILTVLIAVSVFLQVFSACNKKEETKYLDVYFNYDEVGEFSSMEKIVSLPDGYQLYLSNDDFFHSYSDYGYLKSIDAFIIRSGATGSYAKLDVLMAGETVPLFAGQTASEIIQIQVRHGLIAVMTTGTNIGVYDPKAREWILPVVGARAVAASISSSIDQYLKILSKDYIAVAPTADTFIQSKVDEGTASFYNSKMSIYSVKTKTMVGRVECQTRALSALAGFDDYVVVTGDTSTQGRKQTKIIRLDSAEENWQRIFQPTVNGIYEAYTSAATDGIEATYFGGGKFLIHQETAGNENAYFYKEPSETEGSFNYWQVYRWVYQADTDQKTAWQSDILMLSITNEYYEYDTGKQFNAKSFLKSGYSYVGFALYRNPDKTVDYDQFIIDRDFNIVLSLSRNFGMNFDNETEVTSTSFYELILTYVGGYGVVQVGSGAVKLYDANGKIVCMNNEHNYLSATYNSGMIVCSIKDEARSTQSKTEYLYGAVDITGRITVPFIYTKLTMFTGFYAIGERLKNNKTSVVLVAKNGYEIELGYNSVPNDIFMLRYNASNAPIYKTGCYVYYSGSGDAIRYGLKNTNINQPQNKLSEPIFTNVVLYSPLQGFGEVYAVVKEQNKNNFDIYKLK
jgi:hypothetical protein